MGSNRSFTDDSDEDYTSAMETEVMKTAVSIPSDLFQQAEELAQQLGLTRDELYTRALNSFLDSHCEDEITRSLNEVYSRVDSSLDPIVMQMQLTALDEEDW